MAPKKRKTTRRKTTTRKRATTTRRAKKTSPSLKLKQSTQRNITGVLLVGAGILLLLTLQGNAGTLGDFLEAWMAMLFGRYSMVFPIFLILWGAAHLIAKTVSVETQRTVGFLIVFLSFLGIMHLGAPFEDMWVERGQYAGAVGFMISYIFLMFTSHMVGYTVLTCALIIGLFIAFEPDVAAVYHWFKGLGKDAASMAASTVVPDKKPVQMKKTKVNKKEGTVSLPIVDANDTSFDLNIVRPAFADDKKADAKKTEKKKEPSKTKKDEIQMTDTRFSDWTFPGLDILDNTKSELMIDDQELMRQAQQIAEKLKEFGVDVTMKDAHPGPTVTQFTLEPSEGVKLSRIGNLKDDLALALSAQSLRIEAPIPGKGLVGVEMPNTKRTTVHLREILESQEFAGSGSRLTLPLGRDVGGKSIVAALDEMPHLLIAGATGSGKSVAMNAFLTALLYQNAPHQLKFILVDPKQVELMPYNNIPHLLTPVITQSDKALQALRWAVAEMGRRLQAFSDAGARNIEEFNAKIKEDKDYVPRVVIVIDELADLMMRQYKKDTEAMVARIAQMARAAGMHLVLATQRPSVDVITGLIKANIPTRISFRTVSSIDSRTVLDSVGAEDLLGKGDMLLNTATTAKPVRVQGIYVSSEEVERVVNAVKIAGGGISTEQIGLQGNEDGEEESGGGFIDLDADDNGGDDLFFEAVEVVRNSGKASASLLQRQLRVGYARAARLLDIMEEKGLIGPSRGAKAREIYL